MALIKCPECEKEISDSAVTCPNCGFGITAFLEQQAKDAENAILHDKFVNLKTYMIEELNVELQKELSEIKSAQLKKPTIQSASKAESNGNYMSLFLVVIFGFLTLMSLIWAIAEQSFIPIIGGIFPAIMTCVGISGIKEKYEEQQEVYEDRSDKDNYIENLEKKYRNHPYNTGRYSSDYLYYCPICGKMLWIESLDDCFCKHCQKKIETPYITIHEERYYINKGEWQEKYNIIHQELSKNPMFSLDENAKQVKELQRQAAEIREKYNIKCPNCGSTNVSKISTLNRSVSVAAVGLASSKIGKQYECKNCKHKW